jgi:hypothetical protein
MANLLRFSRTENLDKLDEHSVDDVALWIEGKSSNHKGKRKLAARERRAVLLSLGHVVVAR